MSSYYGKLRPTDGCDRFGSLRYPSKLQRVSRLGSVTAWHCSSGHQPNFAVLNRGRHLYTAGWPSHCALAHILVEMYTSQTFIIDLYRCYLLLASRLNTLHFISTVTQQLFYGPLSGTTWVSWYQKKHSPTHNPDHPIFISFFHLPRSTASSVQITCLAIFLHNISPHPLWSTSWSGALHLIFHTFLQPISVFCFAAVLILYHLFLFFHSTPYLELYLLP